VTGGDGVVRAWLFAGWTAAFAAGCAAGTPPPAALDEANEQCRFCRMAVSDQRFAAQLVAPYEEPLFFDDLGCLRAFLEGKPKLPSGTVAYAADHQTRTWVPAERALYTRNDAVATPMGSHVVAHESAASLAADPDGRSGRLISIGELFPAGLPGAGR